MGLIAALFGRGLSLLGGVPPLVWATLGLGVWGWWGHHKAETIEQHYQRVEARRVEVEREVRAENTRLANAAAAHHEADKAVINTKLWKAHHELTTVLAKPLVCDPGKPSPLVLGDVPIPADALRQLRDIATRGGPAGPDSAQLGPALLGRAADS